MEQQVLQELGDMKQQIALLKEKLNNQNIINEQMLRNILKERISNINHIVLIQYIIIIIGIPLCFFSFTHIGISFVFNLFTCIFLFIALIYTWWSHKGLNNKTILSNNLVNVAEKAMCTRKLYQRWNYFSYPWLAIWAIWLSWELYKIAENKYMFISFIVGGAIGGIIGGTWGWIQQRKLFQNIDDILLQIKNIQQPDK